jgi:Flp pilus assembly protein TadG
MQHSHEKTAGEHPVPNGSKTPLKRLARSRDGAAAIEFALLAIPYFLIVFAIIETFVAYTAEQLVANAVDTMGRQLRTGNITYQHTPATNNKSEVEFRRLFCDEISILIQCDDAEINRADKLFLDIKSYPEFSAMPNTVPRRSDGDLNTAAFTYAPGGPNTKNMLRAYYKWNVITDLLRPYISNVRPPQGSSYFLIVETAAFKNEEYP